MNAQTRMTLNAIALLQRTVVAQDADVQRMREVLYEIAASAPDARTRSLARSAITIPDELPGDAA